MSTDVRESWILETHFFLGNNDWHAIGVPCVIAVRLNAGAHCGSKTFLGRSCNAVQGPLPSEIAGIDHGSRGLEGWTMTFSYDSRPWALRRCCTGECKCHESTMWNLTGMSGVVSANVLTITNQGSFFLYQWRRHHRPATGTASISTN